MNAGNLFIATVFAVGTLVLLFALLSFRKWRGSRGNKLPLTKRYLRPPGESLRLKLEKCDEKISEMLFWLVGAAALLGLGVYAFLTDSSLIGGVIVALAVAAMIYVALRFEKEAKLRRDHYLGFLGERAVGEELNQLMADGWSVFHDVPFHDNPNGKPFNVDHVVLGHGGLFAIETKTRRKKKEADGHKVRFNGKTLDYPWGSEDWGVKQAQERAHHLSQWLSKKLQAEISATPVLILPGWYVDRIGKGDVAVINEGEIGSVFRNEHIAGRLKPETAAAIRALLDERCRDVTA